MSASTATDKEIRPKAAAEPNNGVRPWQHEILAMVTRGTSSRGVAGVFGGCNCFSDFRFDLDLCGPRKPLARW
jgi:hypothetical protein